MSYSDHIIHTNPGKLKEVLSEYIGETEKNFFLTDTNTHGYCYPIIKDYFPNLDDECVIVLDAGDDSKNITSLHHIWSFLLHHGAGRNSRLINLGGGMITDIGGFAAATYKRGIRFVHIPTSLLAMVDAAIGGKTAINLGALKNQAGSFTRAEAVIIYPPFLDTLPREELISAYAEILKTALVLDSALSQEILESSVKASSLAGIIKKTAGIKNTVTSKDFKDQAERQCLNFGHSIGHGLEAWYMSDKRELRHGYAVAAGVLCESYISTKLSGLPEREMQQIQTYILNTFPNVMFGMEDIDSIIALIRHDKKNFDHDFRMSLIEGLGKCSFGMQCGEDIIRDSLKHYLSITQS